MFSQGKYSNDFVNSNVRNQGHLVQYLRKYFSFHFESFCNLFLNSKAIKWFEMRNFVDIFSGL